MVELLHCHLKGEIDLAEAGKGLERRMPTEPADGYWYGRPGMATVGGERVAS